MKSEKKGKKTEPITYKEDNRTFLEKLLAIPPEKRNARANFYIKYEGKPFLEILDMKAVLK